MQQLFASVTNSLDSFCEFMEKDNRLTELGLYGLSGSVLIYAFLKKRPLSKFTKASDIPTHFVQEKVMQSGVVRKIQPTASGPLLLVNHKPPVDISMSARALPLKIAGVHIDGNGFSWLQMITTGKDIKFVPLNSVGNECLAKVYLVETTKADLDVARALVGLGFARPMSLDEDIGVEVDSNFKHYQKQLKLSEEKAKQLRKGQWSQLPESWLRWKVRTSIDKLLFSMKTDAQKIPALIR